MEMHREPAVSESAASEVAASEAADVAADTRLELMRAAEAILFAAEEPVTSSQIAATFSSVTGLEEIGDADVDEAIASLNTEYAESGRTLRINRWGGGFRLATDSGVSHYVKAYFQTDRSRRLSRSLLETLAIIAYRQPVTRPEIEFIRGVDSDYAVRKLLDLHLIDVVGRSDAVGRPLLHGTTQSFLEQFGLESLDDMPTLREVEEILNDPAFDRERAQLLSVQEEENTLVQTNKVDEQEQVIQSDHGAEEDETRA